MGVILPFRRNKLVYPGTIAGFDPSHPASAKIVVSCVVTSGGMVNICGFNPMKLAVNGTPFPSVLDGALGNCLTNNTSSTNYFTSTLSGIFDVNVWASIIRPVSTSHYQWTVSSISGNLGAIINSSGQFGVFDGGYRALQQLTMGVPYFLLGTGRRISGGSGPSTTVVTNLNTGQITVVTDTFNASGDDAFVILLGDNSGGAFGGNLAAFMYSHTSLSLPQMLDWAADPWSFWYPNRFDLADCFKTPTAVAPPVTTGSTLPLMGVG